MEKSTKIKPSCEYHCEFEENPSISMSSKIFVKIHAVLRKLPYCPCALLPMCPIAHVPHPPRSPNSISSINQYTPSPMCPTAHVPYCPRGPMSICSIHQNTILPMCPIAHVPYCPCALPPRCLTCMCNINHPFTDVPHCPCAPLFMCQKDVKLSKRCQIVKKMSNCQKDVKLSKSQTHRLWRRFTKKIN